MIEPIASCYFIFTKHIKILYLSLVNTRQILGQFRLKDSSILYYVAISESYFSDLCRLWTQGFKTTPSSKFIFYIYYLLVTLNFHNSAQISPKLIQKISIKIVNGQNLTKVVNKEGFGEKKK